MFWSLSNRPCSFTKKVRSRKKISYDQDGEDIFHQTQLKQRKNDQYIDKVFVSHENFVFQKEKHSYFLANLIVFVCNIIATKQITFEHVWPLSNRSWSSLRLGQKEKWKEYRFLAWRHFSSNVVEVIQSKAKATSYERRAFDFVGRLFTKLGNPITLKPTKKHERSKWNEIPSAEFLKRFFNPSISRELYYD